MSQMRIPLPQAPGAFETGRNDKWWIQPLLVFLGFSAFIVYSTWAAFQAKDYFIGGPGQPGLAHAQHLLSPFYSPVFWDVPGMRSGHAWLGELPAWWPAWMLFSPALLILPFPGLFRFTCYYYRGAYYKAFWADPVSCAVGEPAVRGEKYRGEQKFPLILQNIHRYALYFALLFIVILSWDAYCAYWYTGTDGANHFGVSIGSLVLTMNAVLLASYTFGCHCMRHFIGGKQDCLSCMSKPRQGAYDKVSWLNARHMLFAWLSLFWVGFTDLYVRMCAKGCWTDWRFIG